MDRRPSPLPSIFHVFERQFHSGNPVEEQAATLLTRGPQEFERRLTTARRPTCESWQRILKMPQGFRTPPNKAFHWALWPIGQRGPEIAGAPLAMQPSAYFPRRQPVSDQPNFAAKSSFNCVQILCLTLSPRQQRVPGQPPEAGPPFPGAGNF